MRNEVAGYRLDEKEVPSSEILAYRVHTLSRLGALNLLSMPPLHTHTQSAGKGLSRLLYAMYLS